VNLLDLGLRTGDTVRYRSRDTERWKQGVVRRLEGDGSIGLRDHKGASRSIPVDGIEVKRVGPRGGVSWEPLAHRADRSEQLPLL
jgi:hypothetical protein